MVAHLSEDAEAVAARHGGGGTFQQPLERRAVGEEEQSFGVEIQPSDGVQASEGFGQDFGEAFMPRVAAGDEDAARFVKPPESGRRCFGERSAVDGDGVRGRGADGGVCDDFSVDLDLVVSDPVFGFAAGGDSGAGDVLSEFRVRVHGFGEWRSGCGYFILFGAWREGVDLRVSERATATVTAMMTETTETAAAGSDAGRDWMRAALARAAAAAERGEVPVAALAVAGGGSEARLVAAACNRVEADGDALAHAELLAMRGAMEALGVRSLRGVSLWVTLEPCVMCAAAMSHARLGRLIFGAYDRRWGGVEHGPRLFSRGDCRWRPEVVGGVRAEESSRLLDDFFRRLREN